ncbi:RICIN domain-containing protein [Rhodococcus marinonascens]|uniref:RICIN domain-containing protein n=1 Tax=Rhodococcus marinonascens TaxID=38311 RepID=UPI001472AE7D|nr:RICIN domain-containing protein [Rhodococcus marinonascens]
MNHTLWSRISAIAIIAAGILPINNVSASAENNDVSAETGTTYTTFPVSCGAFSNGNSLFVPFDDPVDKLFTNTSTEVSNQMGIRVIFPPAVRPGVVFTYTIDFDDIIFNRKVFSDGGNALVGAGDTEGATRIKLDIDIPIGTNFVSAAVVPPTEESSQHLPEDIVRIDDNGNESATGNHLRMTLNNATEQRTTDGVVTNDGPNASGDSGGGWNTQNSRTMVIPSVSVTAIAPDTVNSTIEPTLRRDDAANEYNNASNFFTFLTSNKTDFVGPHSGFHSVRCSPRDTSDSEVNSGSQPLATIKVADSPIYGLDGRVIDIVDNGTVSGTPVQMWDYTGAENQQWTLENTGQIVNPHTEKCLNAAEVRVDGPVATDSDRLPNGTPVQITDCTGTATGTAQQWQIADEVTGGKPEGGAIINAASGRCLDVTDGESADGGRLQLWDCTGGFNQQWNFPPISSEAPPSPTRNTFDPLQGQ